MKYLSVCFFICCIFNARILYAQNCNCDSVIKKYQINWKQWIDNSDSIFILNAKAGYTIKSDRDKQSAIKKVLDGTWAAKFVSGKKVTITLVKLDTLYGKTFKELLPDGNIKTSTTYLSKDQVKKYDQEQISLGDVYYEIYFKVGKEIIVMPGICQKKYCTIMDNVLYNLMIKSPPSTSENSSRQ